MNNEHFVAMAQKAISMAEKHVTNDSAKLCVSDAKKCLASNRAYYAMDRAADAMLHSVGIFHPEGKAVVRMLDIRTLVEHRGMAPIDAEKILNETGWDVSTALKTV